MNWIDLTSKENLPVGRDVAVVAVNGKRTVRHMKVKSILKSANLLLSLCLDNRIILFVVVVDLVASMDRDVL